MRDSPSSSLDDADAATVDANAVRAKLPFRYSANALPSLERTSESESHAITSATVAAVRGDRAGDAPADARTSIGVTEAAA